MKIAYSLPAHILTNAELCASFPDWSEAKILSKTGVSTRHIADTEETVIDLGAQAVEGLLCSYNLNRNDIDHLVLCTQSSTYRLPSTACLLHKRIGLRNDAGALSFDHGCSGFIYGLSIAKGLISGGIARTVLLVTAETYTKYIAQEDRSTRTIFGDGAAATLIDRAVADRIGAFSFGTDGSGAEKLIVRDGRLFMDGPEIFNFTLDIVPKTLDDVLTKNGLVKDDIDLFVFHQANKFMLDSIRKVNGLPHDKFYVNLETTGNTVSSTIPIALKQLDEAGRLRTGMKIMLMGFGVGLSWGATVITA